MAKFTILIDREPYTYENFEDIPESFDYLVAFEPDYPPPPHTDVEHAILEMWQNKQKELMDRELKPKRKIEIRTPRKSKWAVQ